MNTGGSILLYDKCHHKGQLWNVDLESAFMGYLGNGTSNRMLLEDTVSIRLYELGPENKRSVELLGFQLQTKILLAFLNMHIINF